MTLMLALIAAIYLLTVDSFVIRGVSSRQIHHKLAAGFGSKRSTAGLSEVLKITRKTQFRQVTGSYARLLATKAVLFEKMKNEQGLQPTYDLYVHASNSEVFWFVGKPSHPPILPSCYFLITITIMMMMIILTGTSPLCYCCSATGKMIHDPTDMSAEEALYHEQDLIKEYAKSLRPAELSGPRANEFELEIFTSPGNNEMNVAQNKIDLHQFTYTPTGTPTDGGEASKSMTDDGNNDKGELEEKMSLSNVPTMTSESMTIQPLKTVGFEPEVYEGGEEGFRVKRKMDGTPLKAAFDVMTQSPEAFAQMQQEKEGE